MGIKPPKGVILYGAPGTGKTLLAKAVANQTSATFLRIVGSELIQKYLGDGPRLVRQLFQTAAENAPSIVFIDEIDAIGTKRYESTSGGEREIQRTMLELLNQLDGFDDRGDVKVIMATNKIETLDPALIRPGRIDRKILFENPDRKASRTLYVYKTQLTIKQSLPRRRSSPSTPPKCPSTRTSILTSSSTRRTTSPVPTSRPSAPRLVSWLSVSEECASIWRTSALHGSEY
jgi:ATP-dependent 26S proteasome regulatory subunit